MHAKELCVFTILWEMVESVVCLIRNSVDVYFNYPKKEKIQKVKVFYCVPKFFP